MVRPLFAVYSLAVLLVPRRLIDRWQSIAFETTGDAELRSGVVTMARLEGLVFLVSAIRDEDSSALRSVLGVFGMTALLAPRRYLNTGLRIAYRHADDISVRSWVVPLTRVLGFVFLFDALRSLSRNESEESRQEQIVVET